MFTLGIIFLLVLFIIILIGRICNLNDKVNGLTELNIINRDLIDKYQIDLETLIDERENVIFEQLSLPPMQRRICHGCDLLKTKENVASNLPNIMHEVEEDEEGVDFFKKD